MAKRLLFGIFAHPDDEAFGPSATFMHEIDKGAELHLICATAGEGGTNPDNREQLGPVRLAEWRTAGQLIGAHGMHALGYTDGHLAHHCYHALADKIEAIIRQTAADRTDTDICLLTYDFSGITGHLDHIAISYITTFVYQRLKANPPAGTTVKELAYFCLAQAQKPQADNSYFIYSPPGCPPDYINRTIGARRYLPRKYAAMRAHLSQRQDAEHIIGLGDDFHATDYFHVV